MNDFARAPRVLVVEDDEDIAQALQRSLRMEGYEVRAAPDGPGALEHGRAFAPDLVILDLGLQPARRG
jgi:DNA-binding response OmpR family regulator